MPQFKTRDDIEADMASDWYELTGANIDMTNLGREEVIKMKHFAGALALLWSGLAQAYDDFFPQSASEDALPKHLAARELPNRALAQPSTGVITHTGTPGSVIGINTRAIRLADGRMFVAAASATIGAGGSVQVPYQSLLAGAANNVDIVGDAFQLVTPIPGVDVACTNATKFLDGRDLETAPEMLDRIEDADLNDDTKGNLAAYEAYAKAASPDVTTSTSIKTPRGPGTVDTVITSGTTDFEAAVEQGLAVDRQPSSGLLSAVQAYIVANNPTTDDHQTIAPTEDAFNTTITYNLVDESFRALADVAIAKIWKVFVYSTKSGATIDPTGLERAMDAKLGHLMTHRRVSDFAGGTSHYTVPVGHLLKPGTLTLSGPA